MAPAGHRRTKSASGPSPPTKTLIVDNGAYAIKAGFAGATIPAESADIRIIPNCLARDRNRKVYVGSELSKCKDFGEMQFRRPVEKGYLVNWEAEREIWEHEFFEKKAQLACDPAETGLILTEAPNALPTLQTHCDQMVFEEFGFSRCYRTIGPALNAYNDVQADFYSAQPRFPADSLSPAEVMLVVDSGYSHTTVTPLLQGKPIQTAIRRLDVGGKLLTNYLTRLVSLRKFDMTNEPYTMNLVKEEACYISENFKADLELMWKGTMGEKREGYTKGAGIVKDYLLPDYQNIMKGKLRDYDPTGALKQKKLEAGEEVDPDGDVMILRNERFTVPEVLFNPMDIGLRQPGLAQVVMQSLSVVPVGLWPGLLANIVVVGGNAKIPGFWQRLKSEIVALAPPVPIVRVALPHRFDPVVSTWMGGAALARDEALIAKLSVTKQEYDEYGGAWVARKFGQQTAK